MVMETLGVFIALVLVLGLAWLVLLGLARMNAANAFAAGGAPAPLRFLRATPIGPRERLVVVAYHGEELLLGVSAGGVTLLDRRPLTVVPQPEAPLAADQPPLARALSRMLRRS